MLDDVTCWNVALGAGAMNADNVWCDMLTSAVAIAQASLGVIYFTGQNNWSSCNDCVIAFAL